MAAIAGRLNLFSAKSTCCLLMGVWGYAFWPTIVKAFHAYWQSGCDYQGLLVVPLLGRLIKHNSSNLKRASSGYNPLGLLYLLLFAAIWLVATLVELDLVPQIAIISMLIAIVFTTYGKKVTSILFLPLTCLFLLLPVGQQVNAGIQQYFAWALMQALMIAKQAVYWETNNIFANNHAYDIHAYLGGMHYSLLFLTFGAGYAMLRTRVITAACTIAASFVIMPFILLWLALYCYILLNQWFTINNFTANHIAGIGWALTILGLLHAIVLGSLLADHKNLIARSNDIAWRDNYLHTGQRLLKPVLMASCIILLMPMLSQNLKNNTSYNNKILPNMPTVIAAWKGPTQEVIKGYQLARFRKEQNSVSLAITYKDQQLEPTWKKIKESNKKIKLTQHKLPIHETVFHGEKNKYKINWSVNYINGHFTTNQTVAKALTHLYNLAARDAKSGIITISTEATSELSFARDRLQEFLQDFTASGALQAVG